MEVNGIFTISVPYAGTFRPDELSRSYWLADGAWTHAPTWRVYQVDDEIGLRIPSGCWSGRVIYAETAAEEQQSLSVEGRWTGRRRGLLSGMSAFGPFTVSIKPDALVDTSASAWPVEWIVYAQAHDLADAHAPFAGPDARRKILKMLIYQIESLRDLYAAYRVPPDAALLPS